MSKRTHVLVSGAGIAGPALAWWLVRRGLRVTLVERAPTLREGGQAVDFRGPVHRDVLERTELWDPIHARRTKPAELVMLDRHGEPAAVLPPVVIGGDVEILRGDLSRLLFDRIAGDVETRFGDAIAALTQDAHGVDVGFESGRGERFDLVIAAEGLRSRTRALAFAVDHEVTHHGYRVVGFSADNVLGLDGRTVLYSLPGRGVLVSDTGVLFVFTGGPVDRGTTRDDAVAEVRRRFGAEGWALPKLVAALEGAADPYFDAIGSVRVPRWSTGRVALVGDAAYGGTLGGQGTSLAILGAYVLAGEIARAGGRHTPAFAAYEAKLRPFAMRCQKGATRAGAFLAPRTSIGLRARHAMYALLSSPRFVARFEKLVKSAATDFDLPDYGDVCLGRVEPRRPVDPGVACMSA